MLEKIKRFKESLSREKDPNIIQSTKAVIQGVTNFHLGIKSAENKARERYENHCKQCQYNIEEKVPSLQVEDKAIPELTNRQCGACGCVLSYKLRQYLKPCEFWK